MKEKYLIIMVLIFINCQIEKTVESSEEKAIQVGCTSHQRKDSAEVINIDPVEEMKLKRWIDRDRNSQFLIPEIEAIWSLADKERQGYITLQYLYSRVIPSRYHGKVDNWLKENPNNHCDAYKIIYKTRFVSLMYATIIGLPQLKMMSSYLK